jgi:NADPH-dependent curcumin reductase CurA
MAAKLGARVIATAAPQRADSIRTLGASEVIDWTKGQVLSAIKQRHPDGIDAQMAGGAQTWGQTGDDPVYGR